jgi:hypothetical protein
VSRAEITIEIDDAKLASYSDGFLAACWHAAQWNPAPHGDRAAGELTERIGREIIRRWLRGVPPELWHHQGRDYYRSELSRVAKYEPGDGPAGSPEWQAGHWVARAERDKHGRGDPRDGVR